MISDNLVVPLIKVVILLMIMSRIECIKPKYEEDPVRFIFFSNQREFQSRQNSSIESSRGGKITEKQIKREKIKWFYINLVYSSIAKILMVVSMIIIARSMMPNNRYFVRKYFLEVTIEETDLLSLLPIVGSKIIPLVFDAENGSYLRIGELRIYQFRTDSTCGNYTENWGNNTRSIYDIEYGSTRRAPWLQRENLHAPYDWSPRTPVSVPECAFEAILSNDISESQNIVQYLDDDKWIDLNSVVIFLEQMFFNPSSNTFILYRWSFEHKAGGKVFTKLDVKQCPYVLTSHLFTSSWQNELFFATIFVTIYIFGEIYEILQFEHNFVYMCFSIMLFLFDMSSTSLFAKRSKMLEKALGEMGDDHS